MKRINTLRIPVLLCEGLYILIVIMAICITVIFIHVQIDPQFYSGWNAGLMSQDGILSHKVFESWNTDFARQTTLLSFDRITKLSLCFNYLQLTAILSLIALTQREFSNVIKSVGSVEVFHQKNIQSFTKIYKYLFAIFILSGVTIINAREANFYCYALHPTPLILSIFSLIMAEIFKRGNQLLEDNQLTI